MRLAARLSTVLVVGVLVTVIGLAAGRALTAVRQTPEPSFEPFAPPPAASSNAALGLPVQCGASTAIAGRFADFAWSPDSSVLAATSAPSGESVERIALFYGPGWKAHDIGPGRGPRWSPAGLLAFERPDRAGTLRVVDPHSGQQVAQIDTTGAAYAWDGEGLVFFRGSELRTWRDGMEELRAVVAPSYATKPYVARFSADGSRFVIERRENAKIAEIFLGTSKDGRASPLAAALAYSFAPSGNRLILDYGDRVTLFAEAKASATVLKSDIAGAFAGWSPDGRRALFRTSSSTLFGWDVMRVDEVARIANGSGGEVSFAPTGRWLASLSSGSLTVASCTDLGPDPRVKLTHDDAIRLVSTRPDVVNIRKLEAKLVLWAEIERNHAKGMFPSFGSADPSAPVWLACLSGEVQRPAGWNPPFAKATYSIGLYVLDATDGHELAVQATDGTWCIGDGFDDLHEYGTLPPAWTPPTSPYPTPVVPVDYTVTTKGASAVVKSEGGWSVAVPKEWFVSSDPVRFGAAVVTNYEPDVFGSYSSLVMPAAPARVRLTFELWSNDQQAGLGDWVDRAFAGGMTRAVSARSSTTLAGKEAVVLTDEQNIGPPPLGQQISRVWIVRRDDDTMLVVHALPFDSTALGEAERALATLQLAAPAAAPRATVTKDAAIAIVTGPLTGARGTKPVPIARIDRTEAKLVRWTDIRSIVGPFQGPAPGPLSAEPQAPMWVIAVAGDLGMTSGICRGLMACPSPAPIRWSVSFVDARTGAVRWTQSAGPGDWPSFFDPLPDRSP